MELPIVRTMEELEKYSKQGYLFVRAVCPKCGKKFTSLIPNARNILKYGCIFCVEDEWEPVVGVKGGE